MGKRSIPLVSFSCYCVFMKLPMIVVNFKVYEQATGAQALELAKIHEKVAKDTGANIAICVSAIDLFNVAQNVNIPVFAQHIDPLSYGSGTGKILPEMVKEAGAYGTLLNHAEYPLEDMVLDKSVQMARDAGLFVIACANTAEKGKQILEFNPDLIAVEPPELIGGDISVSKSGPHIIENAVNIIGENRVLIGAGVKDAEDVSIALNLGAVGVLLASGVTKSSDPYLVLMDLVSGLQ